jgi:hypothetical protein
VNLTEWAYAQGIHVAAEYRWYLEGAQPVPAQKAGRLILVCPDTAADPSPHGGACLYGRWSAWNRTLKAIGCAQRDVGLRAVLTAGSTRCGCGAK